MSFPRYPEYKASGVEWLGDVPEHWEIDRIKRSTISCKNGIWGEEAQNDDNDIPCVRVADFDRQRLRVELTDPTIRNLTEQERVGRLLTQGDLLLEKSGGGELQPVGCVVLYDDNRPAICSNFVARVQIAPGMNSPFWRYLHAAAYAVRLNTRSIKQTSGIQNLDHQQYFDERAGFPPYDEQQLIVSFLDRETSKIDDLMMEQRRLIELLKEKRQAVISHAVTKGLNPHAPLKPSGIEWLGDVPEHWTMKRLKFISPAITVGIVVNPSTYTTDEGLPFVHGGDIRAGVIDAANARKISKRDSDRNSKTRLKQGDVVTVRVGATRGTTAVVPPECDGGNCASVMLIRKGDFNSDWLCFVMNDRLVQFQIEIVEYGAAQPQFNISHAVEFWIPVPERAEQDAIVAAVSVETKAFDQLISEAERGIELLQERRTALISAAVTGKIDVRGLVETEAA